MTAETPDSFDSPDGRTYSGPETVAGHLADCTDAKAAIVVDGSADDVIAQMTAAGWTLDERVDHVAGKRIRFLKMPGSDLDDEAERDDVLRMRREMAYEAGDDFAGRPRDSMEDGE